MDNIKLIKQEKVITEDLGDAIKSLEEHAPKTFIVLFLDDEGVLHISAGAARGMSRYMQLGMLEASKELFAGDLRNNY